jgi:hypothetical protein
MYLDKRNISPPMTPLWTPEQLDLEGRKLGRASDWARNAKAGAFVPDPYELWVIDGNLRIYSIVTSLLVASILSHHATTQVLGLFDPTMTATTTTTTTTTFETTAVFQSTLEPLAYTILLANIGTCLFNVRMAPSKKRNPWVWAFKGLFGGPLTISQFKSLETLMTRAEQEERL